MARFQVRRIGEVFYRGLSAGNQEEERSFNVGIGQAKEGAGQALQMRNGRSGPMYHGIDDHKVSNQKQHEEGKPNGKVEKTQS